MPTMGNYRYTVEKSSTAYNGGQWEWDLYLEHAGIRVARGTSPTRASAEAEVHDIVALNLPRGVRVTQLRVPTPSDDLLRQDVIRAVAAMGITPNAVAARCKGKISRTHVCDYLAGRKGMGVDLLQHLVAALGGTLSIQW